MQSAGLAINAIIVIESLGDDELHTGRQLAEGGVGEVCSRNGSGPSFLEVGTRIELTAVLLELTERARTRGTRPILHIEAHGSPEGLLLSRESSPVPWGDLAPLLRSLNQATANNLLLGLACCHGRDSLIGLIDLQQHSPFNAAIACDGSTTAGQLRLFNQFYVCAFENLRPSEAVVDAMPPDFRYYSTEAFFVEHWVRFLLHMGNRRNLQTFLEAQITRQRILGNTGAPVGDFRRMLRQQLRVDSPMFRNMFRQQRAVFLGEGHPDNEHRYTITFDDILRKVRRRRDRA